MELARQVGEFMTWKQVECPFEEDRAILHYLHTAPVFSEDGENLFAFVCLRFYLFRWMVYTFYFFYFFYIFHSSSGLYLASYESESPENQVEKDRWKALR